MKRHGITLLEFIIILIIFCVLAAILLPGISKYLPHEHKPASCQNQLKQWALVFKMYAHESQGNKYPPLQIDYSKAYNDAEDGQLLSTKMGPETASIFPEYLIDLSLGFCPNDTNNIEYTLEAITYPIDNTPSENAHSWCTDLKVCGTDAPQLTRNNPTSPNFSYVYMPKLVQDEWITDPDDNATLAKLYNQGNTVLNRLDDLTFDLTGIGKTQEAWNNKVTLHHLHEGVERFIVTDINSLKKSVLPQSTIPIMWDVFESDGMSGTFNHMPGGSNVLYLDGHVEFVQFPAIHAQDTWPLSQVSVDKLSVKESW